MKWKIMKIWQRHFGSTL